MALTTAEKQRAYRNRCRAELAELRAMRQRAAHFEPELTNSGLEIRTIDIGHIRVWPDMPMPDAERLQELERALRAGQRFVVVVAESGDGDEFTLVHGAGILEAARRAGLSGICALVLPFGSLVDAQAEYISRMAAEQLQPGQEAA